MTHPSTLQDEPKLTIGPVLFHWKAEKKLDFYRQVADEMPVDTVYLGEVVCSKRTPFFDVNYDEVAERLKRAGKRVVFSTLSEVVVPLDRKIIQKFCERALEAGEEIEVNDASALLHVSGQPHRIGTLFNTYNEETMKYLISRGAYHVGLLPEMPRDSIAVMSSEARKLGASVEVQVFGRASLALSARCYHARAHERRKGNCQFVCGEDDDGMDLKTLDDKPFLAINGIQTLTDAYINLACEIEDMKSMGVSYFRLSPHSNDMVATAEAFDALIRGDISAEETLQRVRESGVEKPFANGFYYKAPGLMWVSPEDLDKTQRQAV
ncbi:MAG: U32 family peptidase [Alphaproteobacteria bacterium]